MKGIFGWIKRKNSKSDDQAVPSPKIEPVATSIDVNNTVKEEVYTNAEPDIPVDSGKPDVVDNGVQVSPEQKVVERNEPAQHSPIIDEEVRLIIELLNKEGAKSSEEGARYQSRNCAVSITKRAVSITNVRGINHRYCTLTR